MLGKAGGSQPPPIPINKRHFRKKGELQSYCEQACSHSDMLVWQSSQNRQDATTSCLNDLRTRPVTDFYVMDHLSLANTGARLATSPFQRHRHKASYVKRLREQVQRPSTAPSQSNTSGRQTRRIPEDTASKIPKELLKFERDHHGKVNFQDWTKAELIELIQAEGLEVPGKMYWDKELGQMKKETCQKAAYVEYCRRWLFESDAKPRVRMARKLRISDKYCIVSIFQAHKGGVRIVAFENETCREYQLVLIAVRLQDYDIEPPPEDSEDTDAWEKWSGLVIPRLELSLDGLLGVGRPPLRDNGLPMHFSLTGSPSTNLALDEGGPSSETPGAGSHATVPSRMHVTLFFNHM